MRERAAMAIAWRACLLEAKLRFWQGVSPCLTSRSHVATPPKITRGRWRRLQGSQQIASANHHNKGGEREVPSRFVDDPLITPSDVGTAREGPCRSPSGRLLLVVSRRCLSAWSPAPQQLLGWMAAPPRSLAGHGSCL